MKKQQSTVGKLVHLLALPIEKIVSVIKLTKTNHQKGFHLAFGTVVLLFGAFLASIHQTYIPHFIWDGGAYGIHALGVAPILKIVCTAIEIEI